jgi:hypothetical protein
MNLLFNRHNFINLQACRFIRINPSSKLKNVIKQIKSLNRLVSIRIDDSDDKIINMLPRPNITMTVNGVYTTVNHKVTARISPFW